MWKILQDHGVDPSPERSTVTWTEFLKSQAAVACDFFTVDSVTMRRYYVLFFIDIPTRHVTYAGLTPNPTAAWTVQTARNLFLRHAHRFAGARALVHDRGCQFTDVFDEIFRTEGIKPLRTPPRVPVANAFAERWVRTIRRELLDRTLIWNKTQLERLVTDYIDHYNTHRPHRALDQRPPMGVVRDESAPPAGPPGTTTVRTTRCDGLIHEYRNAA